MVVVLVGVVVLLRSIEQAAVPAVVEVCWRLLLEMCSLAVLVAVIDLQKRWDATETANERVVQYY